jgi:hypothetical protein
MFATLTVRDEGDHLLVSFGRAPLVRKRIPYAAMTAAEQEQSKLIWGWGIHYTPKGWLWNIGGFDCVRIEYNGKSILVGTDDASRLLMFLQSKIETQRGQAADRDA